MSRDQIWQQLKNDKSEIYGEPMLDVFLQTTNHLNEKHFFELNQKQIDRLGPAAITGLLLGSTNIEKLAKLLGKKGFNKLDDPQVGTLIRIHSRHHQSFLVLAGAILQYKDVTEGNIYHIISHANNSNNLEKILDIIGKENLDALESVSISDLLSKFLNKFGTFGADEGFRMFQILVEKLGENINKLESRHLAWTGSGMGIKAKDIIPDSDNNNAGYLEKILELLGPKNLDKLTGGQINMLLDTRDIGYRKRLSRVLGDRLNKLSDRVISAMIFGPFDNNLDLYNAADVADSLGANRISKWLKSNEANNTLNLMKEKVEKTKRNAHDWEDNFNAFIKWIKENIKD